MPLAPHEIVAEFVAAAVVEWSRDRSVQIAVTIDGDRATITDSGRGVGVTPGAGETVGHAEMAFTTPFPLRSTDASVDEVLDDLVRGGRRSEGVEAATAACPHLRLVSRRGHEAHAQSFAHGRASGPAEPVSLPFARGTTIELRCAAPIDRAAVAALTETLRNRLTGLDIAGPDDRVRPAARALVTTPDDEVLLFRGFDPARPAAGSWWFPTGGAIEEGETPVQAARRELREETGMTIRDLGPVIAERFAVFSFAGEWIHARETYFRVVVDRFDISTAGWNDDDRAVISDHRWWSRAELESTTDTVFPEALLELLAR
ncbi:MAG: NUDIX domain-containing protein [Actinomycetota bacterium]